VTHWVHAETATNGPTSIENVTKRPLGSKTGRTGLYRMVQSLRKFILFGRGNPAKKTADCHLAGRDLDQ
jgi:hypothetical protein